MKVIILFFTLIFSMPCFSETEALSQRISNVRADLLELTPLAIYDIRKLQILYPRPLLLPSSLLPQTQHYPLDALRSLYKSSLTCHGPWPVSPLVTSPVVFTRAICNKTDLPPIWFVRSGYIHPGGGSYAYRYLQQHPNMRNKIYNYLHIKERPISAASSVLGRLQRMNSTEIEAFLSGAQLFMTNNELWVRFDNEYRVYNHETWSKVLNKEGLHYKELGNTKFCLATDGNICWLSDNKSHITYYLLVSLLVLNIIFLCAWGIYRYQIRRRDMQERMLILQILTHELRTPIASLSMTVEGFRRHFDALPDILYDEFRRLTEDSRRLRQLAEASKDYLQSNHQVLNVQEIESINEWLEFIAEKHDIVLDLGDDRTVYVNIYWLATCLENLLSNANKYGISPIKLSSSYNNGKLKLIVQDQGQLSAKDWSRLRKPFVSESGLGLGLTIVEAMIKRMHGKLLLSGPPTTFILEIPCESNTATG